MTTKRMGISHACMNAAFAILKREFRKWYGSISVAELVSNRELVLEIEILEQMLAKGGV